ncbi:hypothetical protein ACIBKY_01310 [Nonomuraea sp. NPDC050394]|uniref:hypothetical protein n=1 Tax=Nonomuraea sp. NPDC050394 TaxID=3364363 RepID=UPI00378D53CB
MTPEEHVEGAAAYGDRTPPSSTDPSPQVPADPSSGGSARVAADGTTGRSPRLSDGPSPEGLPVHGGPAAGARDFAEPAAGERRSVTAVAGEWELGGLTAEEQTDAFLDALALGYQPDATDPALRLLAALRHDLDDQRRSSVSMTPST